MRSSREVDLRSHTAPSRAGRFTGTSDVCLRLEASSDLTNKFDLPLGFPYTDSGVNQAGFPEGAAGDAECSCRLKN